MSIIGGPTCTIAGDTLTCPADLQIGIGMDESVVLEADLNCPLNAVSQIEFVSASQQGLCECVDVTVRANDEVEGRPLTCDCYACSPGSMNGFSYSCEAPIFSDCTVFNCNAECNGDFYAGIPQPPSSGGEGGGENNTTMSPSVLPSLIPSSTPSESPSSIPSSHPSSAPSENPSGTPSETPSESPSEVPSTIPSSMPSESSSSASSHPYVGAVFVLIFVALKILRN